MRAEIVDARNLRSFWRGSGMLGERTLNCASAAVGKSASLACFRNPANQLSSWRRMNRIVKQRRASPNLSIDADPQQQTAASPLMLVVRSFLR